MCFNDFICKKERIHSQSFYILWVRLLKAQPNRILLERERGGMNKRQLNSTPINTFYCQQKSSVNWMIQPISCSSVRSLGAFDEVMPIWNSWGGRAESCYYYHRSLQTKEASGSPLPSSTVGEERRLGSSKFAAALVCLCFEKSCSQTAKELLTLTPAWPALEHSNTSKFNFFFSQIPKPSVLLTKDSPHQRSAFPNILIFYV